VESRQVTFPAPPKTVFQFLFDVSLIAEYTPWKVDFDGDEFGVGFTWHEKRLLSRRTWTVQAFDRRGLTFSASWGDIQVSFAAKKGGPGSCNVRMKVDGEPAAVRKFLNSDGDRLELLRAYLQN
jgi:hypothetical protein